MGFPRKRQFHVVPALFARLFNSHLLNCSAAAATAAALLNLLANIPAARDKLSILANIEKQSFLLISRLPRLQRGQSDVTGMTGGPEISGTAAPPGDL